jgi:membrane-associated phospholipid phosphatase
VSAQQKALLLVGLAIAFAVLTAAVASGSLDATDSSVATAFQHLYVPFLQIPAQAVALLGGAEVTFGLAALLFAFLWQAGYRLQSAAVGVYVIAVGLEELYKVLVFHPAPSGRLSHPDGPSLTSFFLGHGGPGNSFPSGHVLRAVVVYGLAAFVVYRLALSERRGALAIAGAAVIVVAVSLDRLFLEVHWITDVVGGLLLGGVLLLLAMLWLDFSPLLVRRDKQS